MADKQTFSSRSELHPDIYDLTRGSLVTFVGKAGRISRGVFLWAITILCGVEVQGLYSIAWGIVSTINRIAHFGLERGVVRHIVAARHSDDNVSESDVICSALHIGLATSFVTSLALFLSADYPETFYQKPIGNAIQIVAWVAPFTTLTGILLAAIRSLRIMRYDVYVTSIAAPFLLLVGGIAAGLFETGLGGVMYAQLATTVGASLLAIAYFCRIYDYKIIVRHLGTKSSWQDLAGFSFPVMFADVLAGVLVQLDVLMLGKMVPLHHVGIFVLARRLASTMLKPLQSVDPIFSSVVSDLSISGKQAELRHRFCTVARWVLIVNLPIFAIFSLLGYELLPLIDSNKISGLADIELGFRILVILCAGMLIQGVYGIAEPFIAMCGHPRLNLYNNIVWLTANFGLNLWLVSAYGVIGAAVGAVCGILLVNTIRVMQLYFTQKFLPIDKTLLKPIIAAVAAGMSASILSTQLPYGIHWALADLFVFLSLYVLGLGCLGLEEEDRIVLSRIRKRLGFLYPPPSKK